jgi:autotransporter-associated beta strand protein
LIFQKRTNQTPTMKVLNTLIICLAATLATSKAQVIYDDFSGPAGPLASSPSASLWTVQASPADTASLDGSGNLLQTGGNGSDIRSTTSFNMTEVSGMQFKSHVYGGFFGGAAMVYGGSIRGLYLRNDVGGGLRLFVFDDNGAHYGASFTPEATGALWTLSYNPATSTASAYQNGSLVSSLSGITITDTTAQFYMFQYGPSYINTSYQYVATTLPVYWAPSAGGGGTGTWSAANTNWASIAGIQGDRVQSSTGTLVFGNTSGTVTVTTNVNVAAGMTFSTDAYTLTSGTVTLTGASAASNTITTAASVGTTLASQLAGANGMTKAGAGTLVLSGANLYEGGTTISNGAVSVSSDGNLGLLPVAPEAGNVTLNGGKLLATVGFTLGANRGVSVGASGGTVEVAASQNLGYGGIIAGSGALTKAGSGTFTLSGSSSFSGATTVSGGVLELANSSGSALGSVASVSVATNATLLISQAGQVNDSASISLSGGTIRTATGVGETFGNLTVTGSGFLDFGTTGYANANTISFGTYTPSALLTINNFNYGSTLTFKSDLSGSINNLSFFSFSNGGIASSSWDDNTSTFTITAIPEPSTVLAALGLAGLMLWPARRRLFRVAPGTRAS